jgi:translation initiation factor IF-2
MVTVEFQILVKYCLLQEEPLPPDSSLEDLFAAYQAGEAKELNLIIKADVQGSIEPIVNSLERLGDEKLRVKILHQPPATSPSPT